MPAITTRSPPYSHDAPRGDRTHTGRLTGWVCSSTERARPSGPAPPDAPGLAPARVHLDSQLLQLRRPPGQPGAHSRDERLGVIGHLRHAVVDGALPSSRSAPVFPGTLASGGH